MKRYSNTPVIDQPTLPTEIEEFLDAVQRRLVIRLGVVRIGQAASLGAFAYLVITLIQFLPEDLLERLSWAGASLPLTPVIGAVILGVGYLATSLLLLLGRPPTRGNAARIADKNLGLQERLSTVLSSHGDKSPLVALLVEDTATHLSRTKAEKVVTYSGRTLSLNFQITAALLVLALGASYLAKPDGSKSASVGADPYTTTNELPIDVEAVEDLAHRVIEDAEAADDAYLEALSKALAQFSAEVRSPELDEAAASRQLEGLLEQLNEAYAAAEMTAPTYEPLAQQAQTPPSELDQALEAEQLANQEDVDPASDPENQSPEAQTSQAQTADEDFSSQGTSEDGAAEDSTADTGESGTGEFSAGPPQGATPYGDYMQPSAEVLAQQEFERMAMARVEVEQPAGGDMGGAGDGSSIEAGHGSQDLFGDSQGKLAQDDLKAGEELELPYEEVGSRRITVDAAPQEILSEVEETSLNTQGWRRLEESAMGVEELDLRHRTVAANYFYEIARLANDAASPAN